jgi:hypothetical protein
VLPPMSDAQREGDEVLARLPTLPDAEWGVTNLGHGWTNTLTRRRIFRGATADDAVKAALSGLGCSPGRPATGGGS